MEICEVKKEGLKRIYKIKIPADKILSNNSKRIDEIQKTAKLAGFRVGKVPAQYLEQRYGDSIAQETIDKLVREASMKLVEDESLKIASQPKLDMSKYEKGADLEYSFECEVFPEIAEIKYENIKLTNYKITVPDSEVDTHIKSQLNSLKEFKPAKDQAAKVTKGIAVKIDYEGSIDGEKFAGGKGEDHQLEIGSKSFIDNFEDQLIGCKVGDHKKVKVKFPKDYHKAEFQGKNAVFEVDIKELSEVIAAELNDDFAKKQGAKDAVEYKKSIKENIEKHYKKQSLDQFKKEFFDYVEKNIKLELPQSMLDGEFNSLIANYLKENNYKDEAEAEAKDAKSLKKQKKELLQLAQRRVKSGIILSDIAQNNRLNVSDSEVIAALREQMSQYPGDQEELLKFYQSNIKALESMRAPLLEDKVTNFIYEKVSLKDKEVTIEQFQKIYK
jgi:trigger factor